VKRYFVTTFGCQMNAHDSERIKGMLESLGLGEARAQDEADVLVFNTCTIREKPDQRFAAHMGNAKALKEQNPELVVAVGGCYAEAQRERLFSLYPYVDVAFGPGSIPHLGEWIGAGGEGVARGSFGLDDRAFAARLPMHRERRHQAWVQISMGCNSKCAYCIVPAVRGRETSRRPGEIVAMAECASVCEQVHLPLQSGSSRILKLMRRTYSRERYLRLVDELRAAIPDLALGTDLIVGFPGETEDDFVQTLEAVEEVRYDSAYTFIYSPRQGTEAAAMPDQVPDEVKHERVERLIDVVQRVAAERNAERIGRTEEVLVEGPSRTDPSLLRGRTRRNTTVNFAGRAAAGDLVPVTIEGATSTTLRGTQLAAVAA
jgi:tRNA A37 methylthiotransferase MiaB